MLTSFFDPRQTRRHSEWQWKVIVLLMLPFVLASCGPTANAQPPQPSQTPYATATPQATPTSTATQPVVDNSQNTQIAARINALFTQLVAQHQFSGSALIARNGQVILEKGYSMASWEHNVANTPDTRFYGYGWFISHSPIPGHPLIWHDGVIDGFRNYIGRYIDDHITIIMLSNLATLDSPALAHSVQQIIFGIE